ncbi:LOW QUALITY PROTEIN: hypothetical protein KUTeg_002448 [Tegillarca granosa]|uniref:Laccase n=1 Tax=Tegillarca granosa TaxID=220873 RepID=A0ABQ9FXJ9_TEGGR|nr:LOW QUALITY PROTEIN: hypothetical protein KUTeg_002448 [Tegillarca granosa]
MKLLILFTVLVNLKSVISFEQKVVPSCNQNEPVCEFNWVIDYLETMVYFSEEQNPRPVVVRDGVLQKRLGCNNYENITDTELERVITAEGSYKVLFAINGQVPGPSIVVYEGQQVVINLKNNLLVEGITIHWHGMVQRGTPWMDGVGTISHCPINAGESFTYRWIAEPIGTHWYHAHLGVERTDGLAGALIVLPKDSDKKTNGVAELPDFAEEYVMVLQDWKYSPSVEVNQEINWGLTGYLRDLNDPECYTTTVETDGGGVGLTAFESAVINGKGHYFINRTMVPDTPMLPYETFMVEEYKYYRFRIVHAGMMFAFRISFDKHAVQVVSVDGNDVIEEGAESVIIHGGERVDIVIFADQPIDNYWIRIETLESKTVAGEEIEPGKVLGVLRYQSASTDLPKTERMKCDADNRCKVINCPFKLFPDSHYTDCMPISDLKSTKETLEKQPVPTFQSPDEFQEVFINFHFSNVNIIYILYWMRIEKIYPTGDFMVDCKDKDCSDHCQCTHIIELQRGKVVQIVLLNMDDAPFSMPHPIHMHGHHFHVLKIGFPEYNSTSGEITKQNPDIRCNTADCNTPTWANEEWLGGNVPGINLVDPPLKDTIMVPGRGYIVLRIKADNPGSSFFPIISGLNKQNSVETDTS